MCARVPFAGEFMRRQHRNIARDEPPSQSRRGSPIFSQSLVDFECGHGEPVKTALGAGVPSSDRAERIDRLGGTGVHDAVCNPLEDPVVDRRTL
jgi:hypothetical protein